ncbi:hypothetical protein GCM10009838_85510 [Catenulispora subtropica]|uniref:Uncharacterized protein n=1 Tax=Catenulispora subtropica TaxID=450798 RepID=A0ABN2TDQ8_9ACTN
MLADQVADHFEADLASPTGQIMVLWRTAQIASWGATFASACGPAKVEAARIAKDLA